MHKHIAQERANAFSQLFSDELSVHGFKMLAVHQPGANLRTQSVPVECPNGHHIRMTRHNVEQMGGPVCPKCTQLYKTKEWIIRARQRGFIPERDDLPVSKLDWKCETCWGPWSRQRSAFLDWQPCTGCMSATKDSDALARQGEAPFWNAVDREGYDLWVADDGIAAFIWIGRMPFFLKALGDEIETYMAFHHDKSVLLRDDGDLLRKKVRGPKWPLIEKAADLLSGRVGTYYVDQPRQVLNTEDNPDMKVDDDGAFLWKDGMPQYKFDINPASPLTRSLLGLDPS